MYKIKIMNEFLHSPIWYCDEDGIDWENEEVFAIFLNDKELNEIAEEIENMYQGYYEFDSHDLPCWFNKEKQKLDKEKMLNLLKRLKERLYELNDGTFEIIDLETEETKKL